MRQALIRHNDLLGSEIEKHGGRVLRDRGEGDSFFAIFDSAADAVEAACAIQQALVHESWPIARPLRVRMALHSGNAEPAYWDPVINRCARLRALSQGGQVLLSTATADLVRNALPEGAGLLDLGQHRLRDLARPERIHQLLHPALPREFLPLVSVDSYPNNLPIQLTSLVGRTVEIAEIIDQVSHHRLTSLVGPGGIGKTRLALQTASESIDRHRDGVWFIDLSLVGEAELVMAQVAAGASIQEEPGIGLEARIGEALAERTTLLVLDNCEHVVEEVARLLERLLRTCPRLTVLATSREPLRVTGELVWNVPALSRDEAALLFNERVGVRRADAYSSDRSGAVNRICARLDGIPLAIELAAARARTLSLNDIESRLDDRFKLLAGGPRTAAVRQRTLRGAVEWSHDLLDEAERAAFRRLSVMPGPFDLAAAKAVISDGATQPGEALDLVTSLAERSLLIAEPQVDESRFRFLETLRHFGREQLAAFGEEQAVLQRLSTHYALVAEREESHLRGAGTKNALDRLESAYPNLRVALEWGLEHDPVLNLRIATALVLYWKTRGHLNEGRGWLGPEVAEIAAPAELRIRALNAAGQLAQHQSDFVLAGQSYVAALEIATAAGDSMARARALNNLGTIAEEQGDYDRATVSYARRANCTLSAWCSTMWARS
jgi:predicted ATPase